MSAAQNIIEQWQADVVQRLGTDSYFSNITVVHEYKGTTETAVDEAIAQLGDGSTTLPGVAIIVPAAMRKADGGQSNLHWVLTMPLRIIEVPIINRETGGNGKWASSISLRLEDLFHNWVVGNTTVRVPKVTPFNDNQGGVGFDVELEWRTGLTTTAQCRAPGMSGTSAAVTITNPEGGSAHVYFTTDGTLPTATNGTQYTAPFISTVGTLIRAVAVLAGKKDSDVAQTTLTA